VVLQLVFDAMRRRDFITGLMASAAWPVPGFARASSSPVIGFLHSQSSAPSASDVATIREGLKEQGYVEGENFAFEFRWGNNLPATLSALAADLVLHRVDLIITDGGLVAARAAKAASETIPIVFITGLDPAENGFVASLNRPGGNATGIANYNRELLPKRLELLRELVGSAARIGFLINADVRNLDQGARNQVEATKLWALEHTDLVLDAGTQDQIAASFAAAANQEIGALLIGSDPFFSNRRSQLVALAAQYRLPTGYQTREFADAGGLMSYGPNRLASLRQAGVYAGRILKGAKPAEMPIWTPIEFDLVINLKTARALGLSVPPSLLVSANDIIR
jgi:putative ABC transport system substrate-binding protein